MAEGRLSVVGSRAHAFQPYPNRDINKSCVRCGRPEAAHNHPELQKAAFLAALHRSEIAFIEGDHAEAVRQLGFARRIAEGDA